MSLTKRVGLAVGAATLSLTGTALGANTGASDQDLQTRINELERQVARMTAQQEGKWLTEARATEIRALVQDVLQDADTRASLLQGGMAGGHDGQGFFIGSSDGSFRLNVRGQAQFRFAYSFQDDEAGVDSNRGGFENTRTKLMFDGHVHSPDWTYAIVGNFGHEGGFFRLEDGWINKQFDNGVGLKAGQFKLPFLREELVDSSMGQAVERSIINYFFTGGRSQGLMLHYAGEQFRVSGAFSDGADGRGLNSGAMAYDTEYSFTGRAEFLFSGSWDQFDDFASWRDEEFGFLLGGAFHWQEDEYGTGGFFGNNAEVEMVAFTVDASVEFGGANLFGALVYSDIDVKGGSSFNPWGVVLQGGFFFTEDWELFGRFEWGDPDLSGVEDLMVLTVGATHYFSGNHNLKWTTDIGFAFDEVEGFWLSGTDSGLTNWRADPSDADSQVVIRTQLQLLF